MPKAYRDTVWQPGQPTSPTDTTLGPKEITDRLLYLERQYDRMDVEQLPLGDLQRRLEQNWLPDPDTLFASGTIGFDSLVFTLIYGQVGSSGTVVKTGAIDWTVVRNGAGDYTVTFPALGAAPQCVLATAVSNVTGLRVTATSTTTARFVMSADSDFYFLVVGK